MKLHEKKQTKAQQQQASHAIALYYEIVHERDARHANAPPSPKSTLSLMTSTEPAEDNNPFDNIHKTSQNMKVAERITTIPAKADVEPSPSEKPATGMSWKEEYTRLSNEIQVRHYSQKTLRPYMQWGQTFSNVHQKLGSKIVDLRACQGISDISGGN